MLDLRPVAAILGVLIATLGVAMLVPALADLSVDDPGWTVFAATALLTTFVGVALASTMRASATVRLTIRQAFLLTALSWIVLVGFGGLPFMWSQLDLTPAEAYFEAMSGLTTTGATVTTGLDNLSPGILLWRSMLHWLGGVGVIVMAMSVLPSLQVAGMQLFRTESSDRSEKILPRATQIATGILLVYLLLTAACAVAYGFAGMSAFDAVNHAMSTISTGGFSTHDASFGYFDSAAIDWIAIVFMCAGALPFVLYIVALRGRGGPLLRSREVRLFLWIVLGFSLCLWLYQEIEGIETGHTAIRYAIFNIVTLITTTGFATVDYSQWGAFSDMLLFAVAFIGGCTGSTSGGLKIFRLRLIGQALIQHARRMVHPNGVFVIRFGDRLVGDDVVAAAMSFLFLYLTIFAIGAVGLSIMGFDARTAFSGSIGALSNSGPGLGPVIGPAGNYTAMPEPALWLLSLAMLLGRLELFTILVLFMPRFWRD